VQPLERALLMAEPAFITGIICPALDTGACAVRLRVRTWGCWSLCEALIGLAMSSSLPVSVPHCCECGVCPCCKFAHLAVTLASNEPRGLSSFTML